MTMALWLEEGDDTEADELSGIEGDVSD